MYIPPHFAMTRPEELQRVVRDHPLGVLVRHGPDGLDADHIPFEFDPAAGTLGVLSAHVARANTLWQRCPTGTPVMVVFRGAEAFISPNWYPSKHEAHRQVPTWNYEVVHAHGTITVHDDERWVRGLCLPRDSLAREVHRRQLTVEPSTRAKPHEAAIRSWAKLVAPSRVSSFSRAPRPLATSTSNSSPVNTTNAPIPPPGRPLRRSGRRARAAASRTRGPASGWG